MREQHVALEHQVDRPPIRRHRRQIDTVEQDVAGVRPLEAGDQPQQRRLAATRRPEQRKKLAFINVEGQMIDDGGGAEALGQSLDAQQRTRVRIGPRRKVLFRYGDRTLRSKKKILRAFLTQIVKTDKCRAEGQRRQLIAVSVSDEARSTFSTVSLASLRGAGP
jgi:hypothetical protein